MVKYRKGSIYYANNRFKTLGILAKIAQLEPPCTVGIYYAHDVDKARIEKYIDEIIPFGVNYKFVKMEMKPYDVESRLKSIQKND